MAAGRERAAPADARTVLTVGLHASASTWVFNVARELLAEAFGEAAVASGFALTGDDLRAGVGRHRVCKTHGWPEFGEADELSRVMLLLSVRDPRDAVVSLMRRFDWPAEVAMNAIAADCACAMWCAAIRCPVLRYEDRFFEDPATVQRLARHLDVSVADAAAARIFAAYRADAVRRFAAMVPSLPPGRLEGDGDRLVFDRLTQIHRTHIGDGRVGKWREQLDAPLHAEATRRFAPFLARFGYAAE